MKDKYPKQFGIMPCVVKKEDNKELKKYYRMDVIWDYSQLFKSFQFRNGSRMSDKNLTEYTLI